MIDGPLTQHALSHVLSDLYDVAADNNDGGPLTENDVREQLMMAGYRAESVYCQVWATYFEGLLKCAVCDEPATHLWGCVVDGVVSSIAGAWTLAPSCDNCGGSQYEDGAGQPVVRAPLKSDPKVGSSRMYEVKDLADIAGHDPDFLASILRAMDLGEAREAIAITVRAYAQYVAKSTRNEIHQVSYDECLLDLLLDARSGV